MSPSRAAELLGRARELEAARDLDGAALVLRRVAESPSHTGQALAELARVVKERGHHHEALSTYKLALHHIETRRQTAWVYAEIGRLYLGMDEGAEAAYYFRRAAGLDARYARCLESASRPSRNATVHELSSADIELVTIQ